jgi:hypothetical protein
MYIFVVCALACALVFFHGKVKAITAKLDLGTAEQCRQRQRQSPS